MDTFCIKVCCKTYFHMYDLSHSVVCTLPKKTVSKVTQARLLSGLRTRRHFSHVLQSNILLTDRGIELIILSDGTLTWSNLHHDSHVKTTLRGCKTESEKVWVSWPSYQTCRRNERFLKSAPPLANNRRVVSITLCWEVTVLFLARVLR